jgi:hypothetical protein
VRYKNFIIVGVMLPFQSPGDRIFTATRSENQKSHEITPACLALNLNAVVSMAYSPVKQAVQYPF